MRKLITVVTAICICAAAAPAAIAQSYPARSITMIVPASAGGPTDAIGRILIDGLGAALGQSFIIENIGGASGTLATTRVARTVPDGYTILLGGWHHMVVNAVLYPNAPNPLTEFDPIGQVAIGPMLILAKKSNPANTLPEFLVWLKQRPDGLTFGTGGLGSPPHISGLSLQKITGNRFQFVPYRGAGPAMQDLIAGHIEMMFDQASSALSHVRAGSVKAFAVTAKTRLASAPEIPTVDEAGLPGFYVSVWHGLFVPKGTPADVVTKLENALVTTLADPKVQQRLSAIGQELPPKDQQTPVGFAALQKADAETWWPIIREANIKPE